MELLLQFIDYFRHVDVHLAAMVSRYGTWVYGILFAIIFCETGLVITPFLPGDSLLFAAGAITAKPEAGLNVWLLWLLLTVAAILGDTVNYWMGNVIGLRVFKDDARILKTAYLRRTEHFFEKYGGKTIVIARFIPIVRTYAPFVAGASRMNYPRFLTYNVFGALLWITIFLLGGYYFGNIPFIQANFEYVVVVIIVLSVAPVLIELWKHRRASASAT